MPLLEAQYASSSDEPALECLARWAIVNAVLALGVRSKTAAGSEAAMSDVVDGFCRNGTAALPELLLDQPSLLTVQALLAMVMFAKGIPDVQAFIVFATNASRMLQLFSLESEFLGLVMELEDLEQYGKVCDCVSKFEREATDLMGQKTVTGTESAMF
mgnify:FL=1